MIKRLAKQAFQLVKDKELKPYWVSRGLIASLFFLFGILLRESGYETNEVLVAWIAVYILQATLLLLLDNVFKKFSSKGHQKLVLLCSVLACVSAVSMIFVGVTLILFSGATILLLPALRESIHNGTLYIRERQWEFGANLASLLANEMGKGIGALFIFLFGYISSISDQWMSAFLLALIILSLHDHMKTKNKETSRSFDPSLNIGEFGKGYVLVASVHNGAFMAIKAILSLIVFEMLAATTDIDSVITTLATAVSLALLFGMVLFQILQKHIELLLRQVYQNGLFSISLMILSCLSFASFAITVFFYFEVISPTLAAYGLAIAIALFMAIGSLFTLGALQYLDAAFGLNTPEGFDLKKSTMHHAWVGSCFAPSAFLAIYLILLAIMDTLLAGILSIGIICLAEVFVTLKSMALNRKAIRNKRIHEFENSVRSD